ncbi:Hsp70 family protein, partial [Candidatus Woesearchaeota archaeon]|nr:Hsp70 family protein [Candidatus Woesearchaeota archaeon]
PTKKSQVFSTAQDNQTAVTIRVGQGERPMFADNRLLGQFDLVGIPPAPRGIPQIEVTFDIDADGIVHVNAKDLGTGKEQSIRITASQKLSDADIEKMKKEAELHAEEDKKLKEQAETINSAEALAYSTEKVMGELKGKVAEDKTKEIQEKVDVLKKLLEPKEKDIEAIKSAMDELNRVVQAASTELYQKAQQASQEAGKEAGKKAGSKDNVVDADFKTEDSKKGDA